MLKFVAPPEATPSPFGTATLRLAPSALAPLGLRSAAKCAPRRATNISAIGLVLVPYFVNCSSVAGCYSSFVDTAGNNFDNFEPMASLLAELA